MSGEIVKEWHFWLVSIATGAFMAFVYDVVRLFRRLIRHGRFAVDLEDILYWTACFGLSFTLLYYGNNGVIRFAAVFGAAVGMLVYVVTVGRFFVRVSFFIIDKTIGALFRLIRKIIRKICKILKPIKFFIVKIYYKSKRFFISLLQKIRLTCTSNRHKMKVHKHNGAKNKKGEMADGRKDGRGKPKRTKTSKKKPSKNTRVSPRQK
ncbi:MAG: spore cortex biosynthesis protein YabQ [Lachnospiraceae bacterium]|nr:spore cortex biosynthesis protein YabQ [Lachnospiraceae bacterium]